MSAWEYIGSYRKNLREIEFLQNEISRLSALCEGIGAYHLDGMPKSHGNGGAGDGQLAAFCDLKTEYETKIAELSDNCVNVERMISDISNLNYRKILIAVYVRGVPAKALPHYMEHSVEWCRYTKKKALMEFEKLYQEQKKDREPVS